MNNANDVMRLADALLVRDTIGKAPGVESNKSVVAVTDVETRKILIFTNIEKLSYYLKVSTETMKYLMDPKDYVCIDLDLKK